MKTLFPFFVLISFLALSCVPLKEYKKMEENYSKNQDENEMLSQENQNLSIKKTEYEDRIKVLEKEVDALIKDSTKRSASISELHYDFDKLQRQYDDLQKAQGALLKGSASETRKLLQELQKTQENLQIQEDALRELESKLNLRKRNLENLQRALELKNTELEDRNKKMLELEKVLYEKDSIVNALKTKVSRALLGYEGRGLSVSMKNGKIYVSMDEKLLFQTGSATIGAEGIKALKELAQVLAENPDINVLVEGHTDNVPYNGKGVIKDNWDLSVLRATTVVRILLKETNIDPVRITAGGRSEYLPVDESNTSEGRAKNRRTEIILSPKINELLELIGE